MTLPERRKAHGLSATLATAIAQNPGRLLIVLGGFTTIGWSLARVDTMDNFDFGFGMSVGALLVVVGYLGSAIKEVIFDTSGFRVRTHEPSPQLEENREAATEITSGDPPEVKTEDDVIEAARIVTAEVALIAILDADRHGGCQATIYLYDADIKALRPFFGMTSRVAEQSPWPSGKGAVGQAWKTEEFVLVRGDQTHDATYGLDDAQQAQHVGLQAVASIPLFNAAEEVIGVLALSERDHDPEKLFLVTPEARETINSTALMCSRILVDLMGVFADGFDYDVSSG